MLRIRKQATKRDVLGFRFPMLTHEEPVYASFRGSAKSAVKTLEGKIITVTGQVIDFKGKPEIVITELTQLKS